METALSSQISENIPGIDSTMPDTSRSPVSFHYQGEVPEFVGAEIERLYGNLYASLPHLTFEERLGKASTYVVCEQGKLTVVLLYEVSGNKVTVLNEVIDIGRTEIVRFTSYLFRELEHVSVIFFRAIHTDIRPIPFKIQRLNYLEDMMIRLPDGEDEYAAMLSPKTRSNVRRKMKSIKSDYPSFEIRIVEKDDIQEAQIRELIAFNHARMSGKKKISTFAETERQRLIQLTKRSGVMTLAFIDGRICGGIINYRIGKNYFCLMVTHDPKYNEYSLGLLCNYRAICEAIAHHALELHFLWGRYHYKYALLALPKELDVVAIYRSRYHFLLNAGTAVKAYGMWFRRKLSLWKHQQKQNKGVFYRVAKLALK